MIQVAEAMAAALSPAELTLYYAADTQLSTPVLVFHGSSTNANNTKNSSRIQIHVLTVAGFQSYTRLTVAPNSEFYAAVNHLPRENQSDEVCRGVAFGLLKYFHDLPKAVKSSLFQQSAHLRPTRSQNAPPELFSEQHVAELAKSMVKVENISDVVRDIQYAFHAQSISHIDADLVLPPGSIRALQEAQAEEEQDIDDENADDPTLCQYGVYAPLVKLFGEVAFLPTSKLRRAPSRPTSLHRSKSFLKDQKVSLRREMSELVDTEERYVLKMYELVNQIADDFRARAKKRSSTSQSPSLEELEKLFPPSLDRILKVNSSFLTTIQKVMNETEEEAMQDLEADVTKYESSGSRYGNSGKRKDPTGALTFAKVLLEWFPQFSECYQEYIRASQDFPKIISRFANQQTSFSQRLRETGEQRLRSSVIEPVQRLPRYSLFIDNIVNYLPLSHPALQPLLKARDVITSICSLDPPNTDKSQAVKRLRNIVEAWPQSLLPQGRFITATDFVELQAPYDASALSESGFSRHGIFLLFSDCVVLLRKLKENGLSARGVIAEVDKPSASAMMGAVTAAAGGQKHIYDLAYAGWYQLKDVRFTESNEGRVLWITANREVRDPGNPKYQEKEGPSGTMRAFILRGSYENKASKWTEEVTKARIEARFSEKERESEKWSLRNVVLKDPGLSLYTAIFEEGIDTLIEGRKEPAPIRIVVDFEKGTKGAPVGHYGVDIVANIIVSERSGSLRYKILVDGLDGATFSNDADAATFMPLFAKRIGDLMRVQHQPSHPSLTTSFISFYTKVLKSLNLRLEGEKHKIPRAHSPVKIISNFLSASTSFGGSSGNKLQKATSFGNIPSLPPPEPILRPGSSPEFRPASQNGSADRPINQLVRLEETCTGYIAAIQARKGNVVGKSLINRATADELTVNDLYNSFIENPFDANRKAEEACVDVLFMAFEKFMKIAWKDQMGPVLGTDMLYSLLEKAGKLFPTDFENYVRMTFGEMAPQNRRAFIALVKLLADLLDGCGNDGDRGALTITFAELLVPDEANPHDFVNLLDRMVDDCEKLFDETHSVIGGSGTASPSGFGSTSSRTGTSRSTNTGSLTSNASSLRRKLGFDTLLRQNSKQSTHSESEHRTSMWGRSRSKSRPRTPGDSAPNSFSKGSTIHGSLQRTQSNERGHSRDGGKGTGTWAALSPRREAYGYGDHRPTVIGAFDINERPPSSGSGHRLSTIGASPPPEDEEEVTLVGNAVKKKKRRSSLSDLKDLMSTFTLEEDSHPIPTPTKNTTVTGSGGSVSARITRFNSVGEGMTPAPSKVGRRPLPSPTAPGQAQPEPEQASPKKPEPVSSTHRALPVPSSPTKIPAVSVVAAKGSPFATPGASPTKEMGSLASQNAALSSPFGPTLRRREGSVASISPERGSPFGSASRKNGASGLTERSHNIKSAEEKTTKAGDGSDVVSVRDLWTEPTKTSVTTPVRPPPGRGHGKTISLSQIPSLKGTGGFSREMTPVSEKSDVRESSGRERSSTLSSGSPTPTKITRARTSTFTSTTSPLKNNAFSSISSPHRGLAEARKDSIIRPPSKISAPTHSRVQNQSISSAASPRRVVQREVPATPSSARNRLQSPTKLKNRNSEDKKAINALAVSLNDEIEKIGSEMASLTSPTDEHQPSKIGDPFATFKFPPKTAPSMTGEFPFQKVEPGAQEEPPMLSPSLMPRSPSSRKTTSRKDRTSTPPLPAHASGSPYPAPLSPTKRPSIVSAHASFPPPTPSSAQKTLSTLTDPSKPISSLASNVAPEITEKIAVMQNRIQDLESRIPRLISNLTTRNEEVKKDLSNLLETEQYRVRELDQLYREAVAENELLYERFGTELGKILKAVRAKENSSSKDSLNSAKDEDGRPTSKDGIERKSDLVEKIQEGMKEMASVRGENARLKREVVGLKTLLKGNGIHYHSNAEKTGSVSNRGGAGRKGSDLALGDSVGSNGSMGGRPDSSHSTNSHSMNGRERGVNGIGSKNERGDERKKLSH